MAFDLARYNLNPFNASSLTRWLTMDFSEEVTTVMGVNVDVYPRVYCNEKVDANIVGAPCNFLDASEGTETVSEEVSEVIAVIWITSSGTEDVTKVLDASSETFLTVPGSEEVTAETAMGQKLCLTNPMEEVVDAEVPLGQNIWLYVDGYELISESASLESVHETVCYLGTPDNPLTLQPGDRLVIDANNYNVFLNNQNAIWYQSGDWLDELNRKTISIDITASAGLANLSATILYTELFL